MHIVSLKDIYRRQIPLMDSEQITTSINIARLSQLQLVARIT